MLFEVKDHKLWKVLDDEAVDYKRSPNRGGVITPKILVMHDTAGRLFGGSSVEWLCNPKAKASAHLVIDRAGEVTQLIPFNIQAWHAGRSVYKGRKNVNSFSIGIELENPGKLEHTDDNIATAWFKTHYDIKEYGIEHKITKEHGNGWWMPYSDNQIKASKGIAMALVIEYDLKAVTTHYAISPGRKVDVNPLFPLDEFLDGLGFDDA